MFEWRRRMLLPGKGTTEIRRSAAGIQFRLSAGSTFGPLATDYAKMKFGQDTLWDEFLATAP